MKRISIIIMALALALCACGAPSAPAVEPAQPNPAAPAQPAQPPQAPPAGAEVIRDGVYYYELAELSGDYGDGLSPVEGAALADALLTAEELYSDYDIAAGQCVYITLDDLAFVDSFGGRECYIYTVGTGTVAGGLTGSDYQAITRVAVDYSGDKTAEFYEGSGGADLSEYEGRWVNEESGFRLDIARGRYTLLEDATLSIWAGGCDLNAANKLLLGEFTAGMEGESLLIDSIDGAFEYQLVYNGGADERFLGEWENDTTDYKLTINETDCVFSRISEMSMSMRSYAVVGDALAIGEGELITRTDDGDLRADGYEGTFYRVGEGRGAPSPFADYLGTWTNEETGHSLDIQDGAYFMADASDDGFGMGMGGIMLNEDGTLALDADTTAALNEDGALSLSDIDGVFQKTGEYVPPEPSSAPVSAPMPTAEPDVEREYVDMRYGVTETSPNAVFLEPETGTRAVFPEAFAPNVMSAMETQYGVAYTLIQSPDSGDDFSLFGSEITAMGYVSYENIGAETIEDVIRHVAGNVSYSRIIDQTQNYVELYELSGDDETSASFKWAYLFGDGGVLVVSLMADVLEIEELALEVTIEPGAAAAQSGAVLAADGLVEASQEEDAVGMGAAIGAWYSEELDAAFVFESDGSAAFIAEGQRFDGMYNVFYEGDIFDAWNIVFEADDALLEGQLYGDMLLLEDVDTHVFSRVSLDELPEAARALLAE